MKKVLLLLFILLQNLLLLAQVNDFFLYEKSHKIALQKHLQPESQEYAKTDLIFQRLDFQINPYLKYIKGNVTSHFKSKVPQLDRIEFDLHNSLTVDSVVWKGMNLAFLHEQNRVKIPLFHTLVFDEIDSVTIYYRGEPRSSNFGSFTQGEHAGTPIIWTLSEPYGAFEWWPCKQTLTDKIDSIDIIVTTPKQFRTASNGILVSEKVNENSRSMHWKHRHPIVTYLVAFATTNYLDYSDTLFLADDRFIEIQNFVYPENINDARSKTPVTTDIMELFNEIIGEYPFADEKYGHAQFGWGGGMEHQTISFMGNFGFDLIAHELAHQWFGDYITLGTWQDIWLNEGFATYLTGLAYENLLDGVWWPRWKYLNKERVLQKTDGSVFVNDTTNVSTIFSGRLSYSKGAFLLHSLRWTIGDSAFFAGLRNYFNDPNVANGFAYTNQFVSHMELAADTSLSEYFNDWLYGEGFPVFSVNYQQVNRNSLLIELSQTSSHPSVSFFEMPVQLRAYNLSKTDSIDFTIIHTENSQTLQVNPGFKVGSIEVDPDNWILEKTAEITQVFTTKKNDDFYVFPNPFTNNLRLVYPNIFLPETVKLYNASGKCVQVFESTKNTLKIVDLPAGFYVIEARNKNKVYREKLQKQ